MALSLRSQSSGSKSGTGGTTLTVPKPVGTAAGDLLLLGINSASTITVAPAGWTQLTALTTGSVVKVYCYYRIANGTEGTSFAFTQSSAASAGAICACVIGANGAPPLDVASASTVQNAGSGTSTAVLPAVTTVTADAWIIAFAGEGSTSRVITGPAGMTLILELTNNRRCEMDREARPSAGATGTRTFTFSGAVVPNAAWMVALRPASALSSTVVVPLSTATATAIVPTVSGNVATVVVPLSTATAAAIAPTLPMTIAVPVASATGTAFAPSVLSQQIAYPASDVSIAGWTTDTGSTVSLFAAIDEVSPNDADYVKSPFSPPTSNEVKVRIGALTDPVIDTGHLVSYRFGKDSSAGDLIDVTVKLYRADGTTVVAQQVHLNVGAGFVDGSFTLSDVEAATIPSGDYAIGLVLGFAAVKEA